MRDWWKLNIAWRYRATDKARRIFLGFDVGQAETGGHCGRSVLGVPWTD